MNYSIDAPFGKRRAPLTGTRPVIGLLIGLCENPSLSCDVSGVVAQTWFRFEQMQCPLLSVFGELATPKVDSYARNDETLV